MAVKFDLVGPIVHVDGLQTTKKGLATFRKGLTTFRDEPFTGYAVDDRGVVFIVQNGERVSKSTVQNIFGFPEENLELVFEKNSMFLAEIVQLPTTDRPVGSWISLEEGLPVEMIKNHTPDDFFHLTESVNFQTKRQEIRFWNPAAESEEYAFLITYEIEKNTDGLITKILGQDVSVVDSLALIQFTGLISDLIENPSELRLASKVEISHNLLMQLAGMGSLKNTEHIVVCLDPNQADLSDRDVIESVNEGLEKLDNSATKCPNLLTVESAIALPIETKFFNFNVIPHPDSEVVGALNKCKEIRNRETQEKFYLSIEEAAELRDEESASESQRQYALSAIEFWGSEEMDSLVLRELGECRATEFGDQLPGFTARNAEFPAKVHKPPSGIPRSLRLPRPLRP